MRRNANLWKLAIVMLLLLGVALSQASKGTRTIAINGHSGDAMVYDIDGKLFVSLESLARVGNGSMSFQGDRIVLTFPPADNPPPAAAQAPQGLSPDFMQASVQTVAALKDWTSIIAYALQHGTPGDGSRIFVLHDKAAQALHLANAAVSTDQDNSAFQLLSNQFDNVNHWSDKMVKARKNMDTGNYSMTQNALSQDSTYQKISNCTKFLNTMLPSGQFQDDYSCH